jgi:hypothetical protein
MDKITDPGLRAITEWSIKELERTRRAVEMTTYHDPEYKKAELEFLDKQIAEKRVALGEP